MDNSPPSAMNLSLTNGPGKRGCSWSTRENKALLQIWGDFEIKYALSSMKRNFQIFQTSLKSLQSWEFTVDLLNDELKLKLSDSFIRTL
ncbi:hypothetical protein JRQ81_016410 [Phrynocephalus forsythii]|uniref:Uncharacterized protein n=1 Tax=Phrynocephalus forsythii TaxID=171643 RepID=A0A9Q0XS64_9SAUR|nr:hypothetical protein JRQ81_016410 [Phrynocephalus forsythii]